MEEYTAGLLSPQTLLCSWDGFVKTLSLPLTPLPKPGHEHLDAVPRLVDRFPV